MTKNDENTADKTVITDANNTETVIDFGEKRVPRQNYSRIITLDKKLLENCGCDTSPDTEIKAKVQLVKKSDEDFIKITPFCEPVKVESQTDSGEKVE